MILEPLHAAPHRPPAAPAHQSAPPQLNDGFAPPGEPHVLYDELVDAAAPAVTGLAAEPSLF